MSYLALMLTCAFLTVLQVASSTGTPVVCNSSGLLYFSS